MTGPFVVDAYGTVPGISVDTLRSSVLVESPSWLSRACARRNALFVLFALPGIIMSSWVSRTPDIRDLIGATTGDMGLVLAGLSAGSMIGVLSGGPMVVRLGARRVTLVGASSVAFGGAVIGLGAGLGDGLVVTLGLAFLGLGIGSSEISINVEGGGSRTGSGNRPCRCCTAPSVSPPSSVRSRAWA
jgi:MFS family permease